MPYKVKLDVFEGPLDLLLHLIKENEVEIYDIPIALITEQYLEYMELMQHLNLELAGDYLLMASTLAYLKSKTLLPKHEIEDELAEDEGVDPHEELVHKLVEYKKFKEAALSLKERELDQSQVFTRIPSQSDQPGSSDLLVEVSVFELLKSLQKILDRIGEKGKRFTVTLEEISVTDKLNELMERLESTDYVTFDSLFEDIRTSGEIVATFLAMLELLKLRLVKAHQAGIGGEILIYKIVEDNPKQIESEFDTKDNDGD